LATEFTSEHVQLWKTYSAKIWGPQAAIRNEQKHKLQLINRTHGHTHFMTVNEMSR